MYITVIGMYIFPWRRCLKVLALFVLLAKTKTKQTHLLQRKHIHSGFVKTEINHTGHWDNWIVFNHHQKSIEFGANMIRTIVFNSKYRSSLLFNSQKTPPAVFFSSNQSKRSESKRINTCKAWPTLYYVVCVFVCLLWMNHNWVSACQQTLLTTRSEVFVDMRWKAWLKLKTNVTRSQVSFTLIHGWCGTNVVGQRQSDNWTLFWICQRFIT